ncbi:MAG: hypothetical protein ACJATI_002888 [Halioglobus sp.]|jgi:hypothetical protein
MTKRNIPMITNNQSTCFVVLILAIVALFIVGCQDKTDPPEEINPISISKRVAVTIDENYRGYYGGAGYVNDTYTEFASSQFGTTGLDHLFSLQLHVTEWYKNEKWAPRQIISIERLELANASSGDTLYLENLKVADGNAPFHFVINRYGEGTDPAECYLLDSTHQANYIYVRSIDEDLTYLEGRLHMKVDISDLCPDKGDPNKPDSYTYRDVAFVAKRW